MANSKVKILAVHSPMHSADDIAKIMKSIHSICDQFSISFEIMLWNPTQKAPNMKDMLVSGVLIAITVTGGTEMPILKEFQSCEDARHLVVISHPEHNSFAAGVELVAYVNNYTSKSAEILHMNESVFHGAINAAEVGVLLRAVSARKALEGLKLGVLGNPSDWLLTSQNIVNNEKIVTDIEQKWGLRLHYHGLEDLVQKYTAAIKTKLTTDVEECASSLLCCESDCWQCDVSGKISEEDARGAALLMKLLRSLIKEEKFDSITLRCFDLLKYNVSGCFALSDLNDSGFVAGCEGDIHATVTMIIGQMLSKYLSELERAGIPPAPVLMNPVDFDVINGIISFAHCTVPRSIVDDYVLRTHFESGKSVAIQGKMKPGVYTIARVDLVSGKIFCVSGESVLPSSVSESCCRTQVSIQIGSEAAGRFSKECLGNHHILIPGDVSKEFLAFMELFCKD